MYSDREAVSSIPGAVNACELDNSASATLPCRGSWIALVGFTDGAGRSLISSPSAETTN